MVLRKKKSSSKLKKVLGLERENRRLRNIIARHGISPKTGEESFYLQQPWVNLRYQFLRDSDRKCSLCKSEEFLQVDHILPRSKYPELELDPRNLQILCARCNYGKSNKDTTRFKVSYEKEEVGRGE